MPEIQGVDLHVESSGTGSPVVFVHGSWGNASSWEPLLGHLPAGHRLIRYDRRGHSRSATPPGQGSVRDDVADLAGIVREIAGQPAHIVGNSFGATIALRFAGAHPELVRTLAAHEPDAWSVAPDHPAVVAVRQIEDPVVDLLARGDLEGGTRLFIETIFGRGAWEGLPDERRQTFLDNAPTFLDEMRDDEAFDLDLEALQRCRAPILVTSGGEGDPGFAVVVDAIAAGAPNVRTERIPGAGHLPYLTHPADYASLLAAHWGSPDGRRVA